MAEAGESEKRGVTDLGRQRAGAGRMIWWPLRAALWTYGALFCMAIASMGFDPALAPPPGFEPAAYFRLLALNAIPAALVLLLLVMVTRRVLAALCLSLTAFAFLHLANAIKVAQLGLPLLPADIHFIGGHSGEGSLLLRYLCWNAIGVPCLLLFAGLIAGRYEPPLRGLGKRPRLAGALLAMAAGFSLLAGGAPWQRIYDRWELGFEPWSPSDSVARAGLIPILLLYHWELSQAPIVAADRGHARDLLRERSSDLRAAMTHQVGTALPDIVVLQSESLFDPQRLRGFPDATTLANFRALAQNGLSGELRVPTFGGGTIRTEFEVLTGLALAFFPTVQYPYFELLDRALPSLPRVLARHGYALAALHPNDAGFWNRGEALHNLGIDRFIAGNEFGDAPKTGLFIADSALTDRVLAELRDDGPPQFLFAVSMEAHGPYEYRPGLDPQRLAATALPPGLGEYSTQTLSNYLYHVEDADVELGRLATALMARDRRTLLLFYGDHLPGLHAAFAQTGFVNGREAQAQPTLWLLLDNASLARGNETMRAWQLPALLLAAAGIHDDPYFALLDSLREQIADIADGAGSPLQTSLSELAASRYRNEFDTLVDEALASEVEVDAATDAVSDNGTKLMLSE
ncbi:MAG: LTA synthase family protein [Rudaea sp.]|nr:LTA synthase family protein [Rudaea sp.]